MSGKVKRCREEISFLFTWLWASARHRRALALARGGWVASNWARLATARKIPKEQARMLHVSQGEDREKHMKNIIAVCTIVPPHEDKI